MRVSDLVKDLIFLVGSVECFAQVGSAPRCRPRGAPCAMPCTSWLHPDLKNPPGGLQSGEEAPHTHTSPPRATRKRPREVLGMFWGGAALAFWGVPKSAGCFVTSEAPCRGGVDVMGGRGGGLGGGLGAFFVTSSPPPALRHPEGWEPPLGGDGSRPLHHGLHRQERGPVSAAVFNDVLALCVNI